jgi:anhydro-N-acetylmuramic acid kinase
VPPRAGRRSATGLFLGLNSGTSADHVDSVLFHVSGSSGSFRVRERAKLSLPLPRAIRERVLAGPDALDARELCRLDAELGDLFGAAAARTIRQARIAPAEIEAAGLHGQTVCHLPAGLGRSSTLQIGNPERVAARGRVLVVSAFRQADVALGGEGAPLSPLLDHALFGSGEGGLVLNVGGIANLTAVPADGDRARVLGFDVGPGNMLLDGIVRRLTRGALARDEGGRLALRGLVSPPLLGACMEHPFLRGTAARQSTGREEFGDAYLDWMIERGRRLRLRGEDLLATAAALTAEAAWRAFRRRVPRAGEYGRALWVAGGGVHNRSVMRQLELRFGPGGFRVRPLRRAGVTPENRECALFALLAREALAGRPSSFPSATGARAAACLGRWTRIP